MKNKIKLKPEMLEVYDDERIVEWLKEDQVIIKPDKIEESWQQYLDGEYVHGEDLLKKYGL